MCMFQPQHVDMYVYICTIKLGMFKFEVYKYVCISSCIYLDSKIVYVIYGHTVCNNESERSQTETNRFSSLGFHMQIILLLLCTIYIHLQQNSFRF